MRQFLVAIFSLSLLAHSQQVLPALGSTWSGSGGGGGGGTITLSDSNACYTTSCSLSAGVASGDLVVVFGGSNSSSTDTTVGSTAGCGTSGSGTSTHSASGNNSTGIGWCIANATTVSWDVTAGGTDSGMHMFAFHSTSGWNTASVASNQTAATSSTATPQCPSVTSTGSSSVVTCSLLDEAGNTYSSVDSSYSSGPGNGGHTDKGVYRMNVAAAAYAPTVTFTTAHFFGMQALTMATN